MENIPVGSGDLCKEKAFCRAAFDNLHIAIGGDVKPCCEFKGTLGNVKDNSVEEIWRAKPVSDLRVKMLNGERDKRCWKCWEAEDAGAHSLRNMYNSRSPVTADPGIAEQSLASTLPRTLDLRFSNLCNLSCRTCGPECSSKWYSDAKKAEWWKHRPRALIETFESKSAALESLGPTLENVESIYFAGGEPLLHEGHYAVLQDLIDRGRTDVSLTYNTNLSELRLGKLEVLPLWSQFKDVLVSASIDGHKDLGELVREGLSWDRFAQNIMTIRQTCPHVRMVFAITVSVLNIMALPSLCQHLQALDPDHEAEFHFNVLQEPRRYNIQILPASLKEEAKRRLESFAEECSTRPEQTMAMWEKIQPVINFMMFEDRSRKLRQFRSRTLHLDEMRNRNTADIIPELAPLLQETPFEKYARETKQAFGTFVNGFAKLSR
ncbi:MAG: twitch domain-containing radical SAM protein [Methylovirgula sp.]